MCVLSLGDTLRRHVPLTVEVKATRGTLPISVPALQPACPSTSSSERILNELRGVEPGWVEIIPLNRVTVQVRTWLLSAHTTSMHAHKSIYTPSPCYTNRMHVAWVRLTIISICCINTSCEITGNTPHHIREP